MTKKKDDLGEVDRILPDVLAHARSRILPFTLWTKPDFQVNWHHRVLGRALDKFISREIRNLMVFMPPRLGKSEMISRRLPALILGQNPKARIIATSYSAELASSLNRDVQFIIDSPEYRHLFPKTQLYGESVRATTAGSYLRNTDIFETVPFRGTYRSAGVGGGIVGLGADFILIDDPIKNAQEAESETYRRTIHEWYRTTLYSRREKNAGICLVMQRWHDDDLAGRLLKEAEQDADAEQWAVIRFPMISTDEAQKGDPRRSPGLALWPEKYDEKECAKIRKTQGSRNWSALYQQTPMEEKGNEVQATWLKTWASLPQFLDLQIISVDAAFKGNETSSYVAIQAWGKKGPDCFLMDQFREQIGFLDTMKHIQTMRSRWPKVSAIVIEDKANGPALIEMLKQKIPGIIPCQPYGSKLARLRAVTPWMESGNVYIPSPETHAWVPAYLSEMLKFPNSAHSDQVDTTSQALHYFQENSSTLEMLITQ